MKKTLKLCVRCGQEEREHVQGPYVFVNKIEVDPERAGYDTI